MIGTSIGPFQITAKLGEGGMGEVYRARDTKLNRDVALKILPAAFARDEERIARFQREAHVLASLNHPHIAQIYGLEDSGSPGPNDTDSRSPRLALVMELVDGPTLADVISGSGLGAHALSVPDALSIARQIADALEAAHERGIVHRDLKPANVKVRPDGTVKVLDFGLAKAVGPEAASAAAGELANSPTITSPAMTQAGMILGTAAYMAPEQARGRAADKRADIWAFGCVLFEMLAGTRAFPGEDITDTLAAVVKLEPDWLALPAEVPARVRQVLRVCLQKDPRQRGGDIAAIRLALDGAFDTETPRETTPARPSKPRTWPMAIAALLGGVLIAGLAAWYLRPIPLTPRVSRFALDLPAGVALLASNTQVTTIALSPDGSTVAYRLRPIGAIRNAQLVVRRLDALESRTVYEGECGSPFFSPDGAWVGCFSPGKPGVLRKVAVAGGPPVVIGTLESPAAPHGAVWTDDGSIIFGMHNQGLWRISAAGGKAEPLARAASRSPDGTATPSAAPAAANQPADHRGWPALLPGGRGLLYSDQPDVPRTAEGGRIVWRNLTTGEERVVMSGGSFAQYVPSGHLVYTFGNTLRAVRFDLDRLETIGTPRQVANDVVTKTEGAAEFAVSRDGSFVYMAVPSGQALATLIWRDRSGRETAFGSGAIGQAQHPRLSPDGRRLAISVAGDLWVYFVDGRPPIRLTTGGVFLAPLWSPDGQRVIAERGTNARGIVSIAADGSDPTVTEISEPVHFHPHGWLNDGRDLVAVRVAVAADIVRWPLSNPKAITDVVATPGNDGALGAAVSPDGRWLAYVSNQTGTDEVWVRPLPGPGAPIRVSPSGGFDPTWARTGRELYYLNETQVMAASVTAAGATISFGAAAPLFEGEPFRIDNQPPSYDVAGDGRFVMLKAADTKSADPDRLVIVLNWAEELRRSEPQPAP